jgi:hypothetical protein
MTHRQGFKELSKLEPPSSSRMNREETCVLARWQSVFRRHELNAGFGAERENLALDGKGNDKWQKPRGRILMPERGAELLIVARSLL